MHAVTIRRMIVFGVCTLGVGSLYLVPSIARSPEQIGAPRGNDEPMNQPVAAQADKSAQSASPHGDRDSLAERGSGRSATAPTTQPFAASTQSPDANKGGTPRDVTDEPNDSEDSEPPEPVADIEPSAVTPDRLSLQWSPAADNVGVIGYRIWLNGFDVATTAQTRAKLHWFNDDSRQHVVQVRAIDAAGNQSRSSPTLVVTRPSPDPMPTPTPSESPTPTPEPSTSTGPDAESDTSDATPTGDRSKSQGKPR
jgi:hypothetical protein